MRIINALAALASAGLFIALLYTMPKAIIQFGTADVKYAALNVFLLAWFTILFKATAGKEEETDG